MFTKLDAVCGLGGDRQPLGCHESRSSRFCAGMTA